MVDLNKLNSSFDLKDLSVAQLTKIFNENRDSVLKLALIIGSLVIAGVMFNNHRMKEQDLRTQISQLQDKMGIIKARDTAIGDLNNFKSSLPDKTNEFELITLISNYAKLHHVTITSLLPADSKDMGLYDVITISFKGTSDSFKDMVMFLRKIERSRFSLRIDSWTGQEDGNGGITFGVAITAVIMHP